MRRFILLFTLVAILLGGIVSCASSNSPHARKTKAFKRTNTKAGKMPCPLKDC